MTEDATKTVETETLPIDEESGEIDYEKVNNPKQKADVDVLKDAIEKAKDMPITETIAFSIACGIAVLTLAFSLLSIVAVINVLFISWAALLVSFGIGTAIPLCTMLLIKFFTNSKKGS